MATVHDVVKWGCAAEESSFFWGAKDFACDLVDLVIFPIALYLQNEMVGAVDKLLHHICKVNSVKHRVLLEDAVVFRVLQYGVAKDRHMTFYFPYMNWVLLLVALVMLYVSMHQQILVGAL